MNRNAGMDALRIISCFMVVCIHTCLNYKYGQDSLNNLLALFGQSLFRIGLPVFFYS
ncbi:TPA: acyltransferase family protein [Escherichia coli]